VLDFALDWRGGFDPLGGLTANTAYHVGMGQRLGCSLGRLQIEGRGNGLGDAGVQRRGPTGNNERSVDLVPGDGTVSRRRTDKGGVIS
jgi:hypothetical protein